ncbi:rod shape-determining protein MreC [Planotetraspora sp. A-T 1434]|uniref:rod shape-determining protein MreC n=1 Tax=Planotetraspora sp. A-T 1434 TaxID=2979219 RepID=UPI0021BFEF5E|nr:rod shape-determining protein MreC [Planotetraspora sp. A-T 1434]MCT9928992.1 rod shape-determining protein MreC [Planotetraspora sp. A-T 1434]
MRAAGRRAPALLVLVSVLLIAADHWITLTPLRAFGSGVYGSLENVTSSVTRWASDARRLETVERENARLRAEVLTGRRPTAAVAGAAAAYQVVSAHAIGFGGDQTVTLDVGTGSGVARDMTVLNGDGLVGRVVQAGPSTATVLLATAPSSSVGARLETSREVGLVTGVPDRGLLRLSLLNADAAVRVGDRVVTLGSENMRPFVPDVPVGSVVAVEGTSGALTRTALVRPFAHFSTLDLVTVVVGPGRPGDGAPQ